MDLKCLRPPDGTWTSFFGLLKNDLELHTKGMRVQVSR